MSEPCHLIAGKTPLLVSMPHVGTTVSPELRARMTPEALALPDTDWHVDRLYDFLEEIGASVLVPSASRYVIDLNRAPDGKPLYPGASETQLCPTTTFDDRPIYRDGEAPDADEVEQRRARFWQPYHDCLREALADLRARHGIAVLWDAHSIRSRVPRFFEGRLPDLNLGTGDGISAHPDLVEEVLAVAKETDPYDHVLNGRFKGGYITRHYGRPGEGVHAIQLELSQVTYMNEEPPYRFDTALAAQVRVPLRRMLERIITWAERNRPATTTSAK